MIITSENNVRTLVKDNGARVDISDGAIVQYTGIYYKLVNDIVEWVEIETSFIGSIECEQSRHDEGLRGVYIKPLYIWDIMNSEWKKILKYTPPSKKYFWYPHLLLLDNKTHHGYPLYFLDTLEKRDLADFENITNGIILYKKF